MSNRARECPLEGQIDVMTCGGRGLDGVFKIQKHGAIAGPNACPRHRSSGTAIVVAQIVGTHIHERKFTPHQV